MLKQVYQAGYELGDKLGKLSQKVMGKMPFAKNWTNRQRAYPGGLAAAYAGVAFGCAFALGAVLTPLVGGLVLATGQVALGAGAVASIGGLTALHVGLAVFSKGVFDGGDKHMGLIADVKSVWQGIRDAFAPKDDALSRASLAPIPQAAPSAKEQAAARKAEHFAKAVMRPAANDDKNQPKNSSAPCAKPPKKRDDF